MDRILGRSIEFAALLTIFAGGLAVWVATP